MTQPANSATDGCKPIRADLPPVDWHISEMPVPYPAALDTMRRQAAGIADGTLPELVWLLEHPALYTSGTSARPEDVHDASRFPIFEAGRGGQYTYHGPGQRVAYVMLDLRQRGRDVRCFVRHLENWVIDTLDAFNIRAYQRDGRVGVWVPRPEKGQTREDKIAAVGVRISKWVSFHGISLNVHPDLSHYDGIVPCGIADQDVTSFEDLGHLVAMAEVDGALRTAFEQHFGPTRARETLSISSGAQITL